MQLYSYGIVQPSCSSHFALVLFLLSHADILHMMLHMQDVQSNWWKVKQVVNVGDVQTLFRTVDFIGVSAYAGLPRYPSLSDLETSLRKVDQELGLFGMSLKGLGKEIIYSEYGEC